MNLSDTNGKENELNNDSDDSILEEPSEDSEKPNAQKLQRMVLTHMQSGKLFSLIEQPKLNSSITSSKEKEAIKKAAPAKKKKDEFCSWFLWDVWSKKYPLVKKGRAKNNYDKEDLKLLIEDLSVGSLRKRAWKLLRTAAKKDEPELADDHELRLEVKSHQKNSLTCISQIIYPILKERIHRSIFCKFLLNLSITFLVQLLKLYSTWIKTLKKDIHELKESPWQIMKSEDFVMLIAFPILALLFSAVRYTLEENTRRCLSRNGHRTRQTLRSLLFEKLKSSNYIFLKNCDYSLIEKMVMFDIEIIYSFYKKLPDAFSFPIILVQVMLPMIRLLGLKEAAYSLGVYIVSWIILILLTRRIVKVKARYHYYSSQRAVVVSEMHLKLKEAKADSMEALMNKRITFWRNKEERELGKINFAKAVVRFMLSFTPLMAIFSVMYFQMQKHGEFLTPTITFTVISIVGALKKPLKNFIALVEVYYQHTTAKKNLNNFFFKIPDRPRKNEIGENEVRTGEIILDNCKIEQVNEVCMKKALTKLFGDEVDMKMEVKEFAKKFKRRRKNKKKKNKKKKKKKILDAATIEAHQMDDPDWFPEFTRDIVLQDYSLQIRPKSKIFLINIPHTKPRMEHFNMEGELIEPKKTHPNDVVMTILGENFIEDPASFKYRGKIVYFNTKKQMFLSRNSIKDNILFGEPLIKLRYKQVLSAVELDLNELPGKDQFQIYDNGGNLTQAQRIKILAARLMYGKGDIFILDGFFEFQLKGMKNEFVESQANLDENSDSDSDDEDDRSINKLWAKLIHSREFLKHKTVIVVEDLKGKFENSQQYENIMRGMDKIIAFGSERGEDGVDSCGVEEFENYDEYDRYIGFLSQFENNGIEDGTIFEREERDKVDDYKKRLMKKRLEGNNSLFVQDNVLQLKARLSDDPFKDIDLSEAPDLNEDSSLEDRILSPGGCIMRILAPHIKSVVKRKTEGMVSNEYNCSSIYNEIISSGFRYLYSLGNWRIYFSFVLFILATAAVIGMNIYAGAAKKLIKLHAKHLLLGYLIGSFTMAFLAFLSDIVFATVVKQNAKQLHKKMTKNFIDISFPWFNRNYEANVNFLFTNDVRELDNRINPMLKKLFDSLALTIGALILLNSIYYGIMLAVTIGTVWYCQSILTTFSICVQPMLKFISEYEASLKNTITLSLEQMHRYRVIENTIVLEKSFDSEMNNLQRAKYNLGMIKKWAKKKLLRVQSVLMFCVYLCPIFYIMILKNFESISALKLGLSISWSLKLVNHLRSFLNNVMGLMLDVNSYSRIEFWLNAVKTENTNKGKLEYSDFRGDIVEMQNINLTVNGRKALKNVNLDLTTGDVIGIMGRNMSGKHSLGNLMLRLYDRDRYVQNSYFKLFGQHAEKSSHVEHREKVCYLSSKPTLFSGRVRENIDPDLKHSKEKIMSVLKYLGGYIILENKFFIGKQTLKNMNRVGKDRRRASSMQKNQLKGLNYNPEGGDSDSDQLELRDSNASDQKSKKLLQSDNESDTQTQAKSVTRAIELTNLDNDEDSVPYNLTLSEKETEVFDKFLKYYLTTQTTRAVSDPIKKLIKTAKMILEKPSVVIIDKAALDFATKKSLEFMVCLILTTDSLKSSTIIFLAGEKFESMYLLDKMLKMEKGQIKETVQMKEAIEQWTTEFEKMCQEKENRLNRSDLKEKKMLDRMKTKLGQMDGNRDQYAVKVVEKSGLYYDPLE